MSAFWYLVRLVIFLLAVLCACALVAYPMVFLGVLGLGLCVTIYLLPLGIILLLIDLALFNIIWKGLTALYHALKLKPWP